MPSGERLFNEKEASELIQAAARLQEERGEGYAAGVTLNELRRIAQEAGIAPEYLERALASQAAAPPPRRLLELTEETEHVVEGEIGPADIDLVLEALRTQGSVQNIQHIGRTLSAQVMKVPMSAQVEVSSRNGRSRVKVRSTPFLAYFLGLHTPLILSLVIGPLVGSNSGPLAGLGAAAGFLGVGGAAFFYLAKLGRERARAMVGRLSETLVEAVAESNKDTAAMAPAIEAPAEVRLEDGA